MPEWIHNRARHIQAKNPSMPESEAFAIATQQAHAVGKSPKGYGTSQGRHEAKQKYDTPKDDKKTADPGGIGEEHEKMLKEAFSVTQEGHKLDAGEYGAQAKAWHDIRKHREVYEKAAPVRGALRHGLLGNEQARLMERHLDYSAKKHEQGKNAYNPFGGFRTPSRFERKEKKASPMIASPFDAALVEGFSDELGKIAGVLNALRRGVGRQVVKSVTEVPQNREVAEKFVRDAAWKGVKSGIQRNLGKGAVGAGLVGAGAVAAHQHGKKTKARERESLIQDITSRLKAKTASVVDGMPTGVSDIRSTIPKDTLKPASAKYSKVNTENPPSPIQQHQPVLSPPPVRG